MPQQSANFVTCEVKGDKGTYALAFIALLACMVAYGVALSGPLFFDDIPNLLANQLVQIDGEQFDDWRVAALSSESGLFYRPIAMLTFALNHVLAGSFSAISLKGTNLALHCLNAGLIYFLAQLLLRAPAVGAVHQKASPQRLIAMVAALIWLLHPIHVSTVLYAVQRMAQLSTLFTLAGLLLYCRYRMAWAARGASPGEVIAASLWLGLLTVFAILSKENGALLPWLVVVTEVTLFRGIWCGASRTMLVRLGWFCLLLPLLGLLTVILLSPEILTAPFAGREFTLQERLLTQSRMLWRYIGWLVVPNILDMGFFHDDIPLSHSLWNPLTTLLSLLAWVGAVVVAVVGHKRYPLFSFALLFYWVAHSMESSVLPLEMVFEHRNYLASVGLTLFAAVGILRLAARLKGMRLMILPCGILALLTVILAVRTHAWTDEVALARFNVINHPESPRANFFYANTLFDRFKQARALGLPEEEERALAVASRGYYHRMYTRDGRDFAALVMLYQLDSEHFPTLAQENDWLGVMEVLARTRRLQSSDYTALGALVTFASKVENESELQRVGLLLDGLMERYPHSIDLLGCRYRLVQASGTGGEEALLAALERGAQMNPDSRKAAAYLAQYHGQNDVASTYEAIREWMRRDHQRRELTVIREIFDH